MSPSARRLSSTVITNRFAWQGEPREAAAPILPVLRSSAGHGVTPVAPALRDLPSPSVERAETLEREAYARGYADGQQAGEQAAGQRIDAMASQVATAIGELAAVRGALMRRSERDLVRLAVAMAERVLRRAVDVDRELLAVMARVAIERLGESAAATIHLNPIDHEIIVSRHTPDLGKSVELVADPAVARGGCLVRSTFGTIDTGIDSQVRELSRALLGDAAEDDQEGTDGAPGNP